MHSICHTVTSTHGEKWLRIGKAAKLVPIQIAGHVIHDPLQLDIEISIHRGADIQQLT